MTVTLIYFNPLIQDKDYLTFDIPEYDYFDYNSIINLIKDKSISIIIKDLLNDLDCTKVINNKQIMTTNDWNYLKLIQKYYYIICKLPQNLSAQIFFNKCIDYLLDRHIENLVFEQRDLTPEIMPKGLTKNSSGKFKAKNRFYKSVTRNLFTNKVEYHFINPKTGEEIVSNNPDYGKILNAELEIKRKEEKENKRRRSKLNQHHPVDDSNIYFNFNIKL